MEPIHRRIFDAEAELFEIPTLEGLIHGLLARKSAARNSPRAHPKASCGSQLVAERNFWRSSVLLLERFAFRNFWKFPRCN